MTSERRKKHEAVAVGVRRRLMQHLNGLSIHEQILLLGEKGIGRPGIERHSRLLLRHSQENVLVSNDPGAFARIGDGSRDVSSRDGAARPREVRVAPGVIAVDVGVDDVANGLVRQLPNRREHLAAEFGKHGIDHDHPVVADLDGDVAAHTHQHVNVALDGQDFDLDCAEIARWLTERRERNAAGQDREQHSGHARPPETHLRARAGRPGRPGVGDWRRAGQPLCTHYRPPPWLARGSSSRSMNSGYIVSAPPSTARIGSPWLSANSVRKGFSPGRKCGT